jgi:polyhydroxyalkanoate synthesis regulator protein
MIQQTSILIKRYAGERLYDTVAGRYVTVADIRSMANDGISLIVREAADGTDITDRLIAPETRHH